MKKKSPQYTTPSLIMGCILSWLRQQAGQDQRRMAQCLGITQASWSRIENGHATANIEQIINSCNAMGVEFVYVAQLYTYICHQLEKKSVVVSSDIREDMNLEIKKIVKEAIAEHALSVSNKALNSDA
jgi:transcriptional regulator with XRE-family HTH domain